MDIRPTRLYLHVFQNGPATMQITRVGQTPCRAKNAAFEALEEQLATRPDLPVSGWRLIKQEDISHLVKCK